MKNKKLIKLFLILGILIVIFIIFVLVNKKNNPKYEYNIFENLVLDNGFEAIQQYPAGTKIVNESGFSYIMENKTAYYTKDKINISVVEVEDIGVVKKSLDEYYNLHNSDDNKVDKEEREGKKYVSLEFVSNGKYNSLIGVDKYLIYLKSSEVKSGVEFYNLLIEFIENEYSNDEEEKTE